MEPVTEQKKIATLSASEERKNEDGAGISYLVYAINDMKAQDSLPLGYGLNLNYNTYQGFVKCADYF